MSPETIVNMHGSAVFFLLWPVDNVEIRWISGVLKLASSALSVAVS